MFYRCSTFDFTQKVVHSMFFVVNMPCRVITAECSLYGIPSDDDYNRTHRSGRKSRLRFTHVEPSVNVTYGANAILILMSDVIN